MRYTNQIFVVLLLPFSLLIGSEILAQPGDPGGDPGGGGNPTITNPYFVLWQDVVGATVSENVITKTEASGWGNSGAFSQNNIGANEDGWVEFKIPFKGGLYTMVGLAEPNVDVHYASIDYAFYINGSSLQVYESGFSRINLGACQAGELLKIERIGSTVYYKRNGQIVYTSGIASSTELGVDVSLNSTNARVEDVLISHPTSGQQPANISYDIAWTDLVGVSSVGTSITKNLSGGWGTSGAASINQLGANVDGWVEMSVLAGQTNGEIVFGLSSANVDASYASIEYGIYISNITQGAGIREGGINRGVNISYVVGDTFRVERVGSSIEYKKNGTTFYTSTVPFTGSLIVDAAINTTNYKIEDARASFWIPYQQGLVPDEWEFEALKDIYDSLGGSGWTNKTNWPTTGNWPVSATAAEMDSWHGITVINGDVTDLLFTANNLIGKIPESIDYLASLLNLRFDNNKITGSIPNELGNLKNLNYLYLNKNLLTGVIPSSLCGLQNLKYFILSNNQLSGFIPLCVQDLTNLELFYVSTNSLSGDFPNVTNLLKLRSLHLVNNNFTGGIPMTIGNMTALRELYIENNDFGGELPSTIGNLKLLSYLNAINCQLSGSIPIEIGGATNLTTIYLSHNQFSGQIPTSIGNLPKLNNLFLSNNDLSGTIPASIGSLSTLQNLYLDRNELSGSIPSSIGSLANLITLILNGNKLSGTIPPLLGNLSNLTILYLHSNFLEGELPSELGNLSKLTHFYFYTNKLSGELPASLGNLTKLKYFYGGGNLLTGKIPSTFSALTELYLFYVNGNKLSGEFPAFVGNWTKLGLLNIGGNSFSGDFPPSIGSCQLLTYFRCDNNKFTSLPSSVLSIPGAAPNFANNELKSIPNFATHSNPSSLWAIVENNRLDFTHIEPLKGVSFTLMDYSPQKTINDISHVSIMGSLTIPARPLTPNTTIIWEKQSGTSWVNVNSSNEDATQQTYYIANASSADEGVYRYKMTNSVVTGMTIQSEPITVKTAKAFALDNWAFQYKYDARKRMTHKKLPGADWMYMVYDDRDRLVMTQDGEQRKFNKWSFTKYDALNRPIITGIYTHSSSVDQETMSGLISTTQFYEVFDGALPQAHGYTNNIFPNGDQQGTKFEPLTITYYDNYDFLNGNQLYAYRPNQLGDKTLNGVTYSQPGAPFSGTRGQITGQDVRTLGGLTLWERQVNYYDEKYNPIQTLRDDHRGSVEITTQIFDFTRKPLAQKTVNEEATVSWQNLVGVVTEGNDKLIRLQGVGWDAGASSVEVLAANEDGWLEVTAPLTNTNQIIGFSASDVNQDKNTINYGIYFQQSNYYIYENGIHKKTIYEGSGSNPSPLGVNPGDFFKIERIGGVIKYYWNGALLYTSSTNTNDALLIDASLYNVNSSLVNIRSSFSTNRTSSITRTFEYDHAGRLIDTKHTIGGKVPWSELENVTDFGDKIGKTSGGVNVWDATATTLPIFGPGQDGWVDAKVEALSGSFYGFEEIDNSGSVIASYHIRVSAMGSQIIIYKDGSVVTYNGGIINAGDRIKVERSGNTIFCKLNDQIRYTFNNVNPINSLRVSAIFLHANQHFLYDTQYGFPEVLLSHNEYNELGQLIDKKLHSTDPENTPIANKTFKQSVDYRYNIRGWLTKINDSNVSTSSAAEDANVLLPDLFGMNLHYQDQVSGLNNNPLFNGNISAITWSANQGLGAVKQHAYNYGYDPMNRITSADFQKNIGDWEPSNDFQVSGFEYDLNGNIKALSRKDDMGADMDVLTYNYGSDETLGNQLRWVSDAAPGQKGFVDGNSSGDDYLYDANGNMTVDKNKNITAITYNHLNLPEKVTKGTGEYIKYIYDAGGRKLSQQVFESNNTIKKTTDYVGEYVYENDTLRFVNTEEGRVTMKDGEAEYQYHLKDHLGNVRVTFTTKDEVEEEIATLEPSNAIEERGQFLHYDDVRLVNSKLFDHTYNTGVAPPEGASSIRLSGKENERIGLAKSLAVVPGDKIQLEVFAKYVDISALDPNSAAWSVMTSLLSNINNGAVGTVIDGAGYAQGGSNIFPYPNNLNADKSNDTNPGIKAYLNYLVFNRDFVPQLGKSGFKKVTGAAKEDGVLALSNNGEGVAHERLDWEIDITEPGYVYIWLSNEEVELGGTPVEVYFDDFKVNHIKSPVVQSDEYYPFGLTFNSYQRENAVPNQYHYNGKEKQDELGFDWLDYGARMYIPEIGRWGVIDPMAELTISESIYGYVSNSPINLNDPTGMMAEPSSIKSTFVDPNGKVIKHIDDGDDNVYLVSDLSNWNGSKDGLSILGKEDPNVQYKAGDTYKYHSGYDQASLINYLNTITAYGLAQKANNNASKMLDEMSVNFAPVFSESGEVIGLIPKGKGALTYKFVRFSKGVFEFIGPFGDVVLTIHNANQFAAGKMGGGRFTYNLVGTGAGLYAAYSAGGPAGIAIGTIFLLTESVYDYHQSLKEVTRKNAKPSDYIRSWDDLKRKFFEFNHWIPKR